jgi:acyl CoA:acetate/3-ketoacid CoA transferase beta subunit
MGKVALRSRDKEGDYINLGIGIPADKQLDCGMDLVLQSEIGMLKTGALADGDDVDQT